MESTDQTTQQLMFSLIEIWKSSAQTQRQFCKSKDLDYKKFQYWFRKYRSIQSLGKRTDSKFFKQIKLKAQFHSTDSGMELVFPDGRKLIFHQLVEASYLRTLLN